MMNCLLSKDDQEFRRLVESCEMPVADFDHQAHIRLAYAYLAENTTDKSVKLMRDALTSLRKHAGIDPSKKYHETLTEAWILATHHFMKSSGSTESAHDFIERNTVMLDSQIMMTHYSADLLFSNEARLVFVEPDLDPIPRHDE